MMPHNPPPDEWEEDSSLDQSPQRPKNWVSNCRVFFGKHWQPKTLTPPKVDPQLQELSFAERPAEVLRYSVRKAEYWLSPKGHLREWLRFNLKAAVLLGIPALLVVPLVTFALGQFNTWTTLLAQTTSNMVLFPMSALLVVGLISGLIYIVKSAMIMRLRSSQQRRDPYGY